MMRRRVQVYDLEAERKLIGSVLIDPLLIETMGHVRAQDFYSPAHRTIWQALQSLAGQVFEPVLVRASLVGRGADEATLEALRVAEEGALSSANSDHYAGIILDRATRRRLMEAGEKILQLAGQPAEDTDQLVDQAQAALSPAGDRRRGKEPIGSPEAFRRALKFIQAQREAGGMTGVTWGLPSLDQRTTGMNPGELWVLAARPGMGKSAFAVDVAKAAAGHGKSVLLSSLEMKTEMNATRALAGMAQIGLQKLRSGALSADDMMRVEKAVGEGTALPIWWDDDSDATVLDLRAKARRIKQRDPNLGLVIVDYLQLLEGVGESEARHLEVAAITRGLKRLAGELDLPVLALSQLSRDVEKTKRSPVLSDLRESGAIEQDADGVVFIHREGDAEDENEGRIECFLVVAKARNGPSGFLPVTFVSSMTTFEDGWHRPEPPAESGPDVVEFHRQAPRGRRGRR